MIVDIGQKSSRGPQLYLPQRKDRPFWQYGYLLMLLKYLALFNKILTY